MKLTIVEKNLLSWTAMHIDFVMCKNHEGEPFEKMKDSEKNGRQGYLAPSRFTTPLKSQQMEGAEPSYFCAHSSMLKHLEYISKLLFPLFLSDCSMDT